MNRAQISFGVFTLIVGVGIGYLMYTHPEGLNPSWPMWMAMLVPALFALGGLHIIAAGLDRPRLSAITLRAILVCLWAIINWAAFFTTGVQCRAAISFFGAQLINWYPSEVECQKSLQAIIASLDTLVVIVFIAFAWHRHRASRKESSMAE